VSSKVEKKKLVNANFSKSIIFALVIESRVLDNHVKNKKYEK